MYKFKAVKTIQDGIYLVGEWLHENYQDQDLTNIRLKALFAEFIPNHSHICDALTRGSGRIKKGAWKKVKAIGYYQELLNRIEKPSNSNLQPLSEEEMILCAVLLRYQKGHQGNASKDYWHHKLLVSFMAENPQYQTPSSAAHALAKKLNTDQATTGEWHKMAFLGSYQRIESRTKAT